MRRTRKTEPALLAPKGAAEGAIVRTVRQVVRTEIAKDAGRNAGTAAAANHPDAQPVDFEDTSKHFFVMGQDSFNDGETWTLG